MFNPFSSVPPKIIVTRFSVFGSKAGGLRLRDKFGENTDEFANRLFDPNRLQTRLDILTNISAPAISMVSEEFNVRHLVQYSNNLPAPFKEALLETSERYESFCPVVVSESNMADSVDHEVRSWGKAFRGLFSWTRLDDDDLLSKSFFESLNNYVNENSVGMAITFPKQAATLYSNGLVTDFHCQFVRNPSAGQTYICRANNSLEVLETPGFPAHHEIDRKMPTVVDPTIVGSLQILHATQDTSSFDSPLGGRLINRLSQLNGYGVMNLGEVKSEFPNLIDRSRFAKNSEYDAVFELGSGQANSGRGAEVFKPGSVYRIDYVLSAERSVGDDSTLCFRFSDPGSSKGHFPRTPERGDYLRLYSDKNGEGSAFVVIPEGSNLQQVRLNYEGPQENLVSGKFKVKRAGDPEVARIISREG